MEELPGFQAKAFDGVQTLFRCPLTPIVAVGSRLFFVGCDRQCLFHLPILPTGGASQCTDAAHPTKAETYSHCGVIGILPT
jgi:hypothetical protein